jgi:hypothetical protein
MNKKLARQVLKQYHQKHEPPIIDDVVYVITTKTGVVQYTYTLLKKIAKL